MAAMSYDSTDDTLLHIQRVRHWLAEAIRNLNERYEKHDLSKLSDPEKEAWDIATPKLKDYEYGSEGYKATLREIKPAVQHHYKNNDHHPEYYETGINGMSLMALMEMLADWKAATERSPGGNLERSIQMNQERFGYTDQVRDILDKTARELGYYGK